MKKVVFGYVFAAIGVMPVCGQRGGGGALEAFTLEQSVELRDGAGETSSFAQVFVQRADGAHARIEVHEVAGVGRCESGGLFTATARVSFNTCTQARSTFPARSEVERQSELRRRESCVGFLAGSEAGPRGSRWGVRTEEYVVSNQEEDAVYVVSPDLGCESLSEVHKWKGPGGTPSGGVTAVTTKALKTVADGRYFAAADSMHEMAPSEARKLWAAKLGHSTSAPWFERTNTKLDAQYRARRADQ